MLKTLSDLFASALCVVAFVPFLLLPGYLVTTVAVLQRMRRTWVTRALWSIVLSLPVSLLLGVALGSLLRPGWVLACFGLLDVAALTHLFFELRGGKVRLALRWDREIRLVLLLLALLILYCLLGPLSVQFHHHVYEGAMWQDWSVRIQMIYAALRGGMPPGNPFFSVAGQAPALRYYFYWYVLCGQICRITGADAKAALVASCVWSGFALAASLLLSLRYLGVGRKRMRAQGAVALLVLCVTGLDVIPAVIGLFLGRRRLYPDIEFWHDDRSPSWLGSLLWAPHHVGGFVCCMTAVLLLFLLKEEDGWVGRLIFAVLVAVCLSAALGTSTYITCFFVLAIGLLVLERAFHGDLRFGATVMMAGILSVAFSYSYVHDLLLSHSVGAVDPHGVHKIVRFALRNDIQANRFYLYFFYTLRHLPWPAHASVQQRVIRFLFVSGMFITEFGFFFFVLVDRVGKDLRGGLRHKRMRWLWILFLSFAVPGLMLSSSGLQGNNDLGRHAGMCARFVLIVWATPLVTRFLADKQRYTVLGTRQRLFMQAAAVCFGLGLVTQVWEIAINRIYVPLTEAEKSGTTLVALRFPHISTRFYDIRQAMEAAAEHSGARAIVQSDPQGRLQPMFLLYTSRQMAAGDIGCASPFGGDPALCPAVADPLIRLFGGSGPRHQADYWDRVRFSLDQTKTTPQNFAEICVAEGISVLVASYADPVWKVKESWVWQEKPVFANATARVFLCPGTAAGR